MSKHKLHKLVNFYSSLMLPIYTQVNYNVTDKDKLMTYLVETKYLHILSLLQYTILGKGKCAFLIHSDDTILT